MPRGSPVDDDVGEDPLGQVEGDGLVVEAGEGGDPDQGALELADVVLHVGGDEFEDVVGDVVLVGLGLRAQDGQAGLDVGRVDLGDEAREEAAAQPVLEGVDRLGRPVRGEHDLLAGAVEVVVGVEELLLEPLFVLHELHVVDEQDVALPVAPLEGDGGGHPQGVDEVVHEGLGGDVQDAAGREVLLDVVADGVEEVGLAQARVAVDEQAGCRSGPGSRPRPGRRRGPGGSRRP